MYKNYTNADCHSTDLIGQTWNPFAEQTGLVAWVSPEALTKAGITKQMRDATCWNGGYAVLYEGDFDEAEAAEFVVAGLRRSCTNVNADLIARLRRIAEELGGLDGMDVTEAADLLEAI